MYTVATTIQVDKITKSKLEALKIHPRETYNEVLKRIISEMAEEEEELSPQAIKGIEDALKDVKAGRVYSSDQVRKRLKI